MRERIVRKHMAKHGGRIDEEAFIREARAKRHPAHDWFEWEDGIAGHEYRLFQVRQFVVFYVERDVDESTGPAESRKIVMQPSVVSPMSDRRNGGPTYISVDTEEGKLELRRQALVSTFSLNAWMKRYQCVMNDEEIRAAKILIKIMERNTEIDWEYTVIEGDRKAS